MLKLGFDVRWVSLLMNCVASISYKVNLNGKEIWSVTPHRGLRQGDLLSPYLFILCAEGLSALFQHEETQRGIHNVKICLWSPSITHLLFANDSCFFSRANDKECLRVKAILQTYEETLVQAINLHKSSVFYSANTASNLKSHMNAIFGVHNDIDHGGYLRLRSMVGWGKKRIFNFVKDMFAKRLQGWSTHFLSRAG